jgi:hypothetical protein
MDMKVLSATIALGVLGLLGFAQATARADRQMPWNSAIMTLYNVASTRNVESGDISFNSISSAASTQIENWARLENIPIKKYVFNSRGYTLVYGGKSYDCFRYPTDHGHSIVCVGDEGTFLGSIAVPRTVPEPPQ